MDVFIKDATLRLESKVKELEEIRVGLEEKIEERTKELQGKLKELEDSRKALMNILEDVEESRGRAEDEKEKTLLVINNFADGLIVFDKNNNLDLINPQAEKSLDIKKRDIIGRSLSELKTFPTIEPVADLLNKETGEIFRKEIKIESRGDLVLEVSTVPILTDDIKTGTMLILHDVSREKMVEKMKTEFVSLAAHQLRTPLSAIKWTLRMLLDGDLGKITDEQGELVSKCYQSNERMIGLINDLLDITRIEEGRYIYGMVMSNMEDIIQFVINTYKEGAERKNIKINFKKSEDNIPKVNIDVEKMKLAIQNLIDNAVKYTPSGGVVTVSLKRGKKEVDVEVRDTGMGIPEDQSQRVFSKFFRGANAVRVDTEGSGLGLFLAKNIIEAHGGKIWFESGEGVGTTFYFNIPLKEEFAEFVKRV
jgi:PAS domain S-box-containing protein